jgi:hypothetical protein
MTNIDPLEEFERLSARLKADQPPAVHVAHQVIHRIRAAEPAAAAAVASERTLAFMALGSCAAAATVVMVGLSWLSELADPLGALFEIVPPIGL